jgi:hypothetical protein
MAGRSLVLDPSAGSVYVIGSMHNTAYNKNVFCIEKYDNVLNFEWRRTLDFNYGISNASAEGLKGVFSNGYLYVAGYVVTGDPSLMEDWTVAAISPAGAFTLGLKKIPVAGNGRPTDCGINSFGFYVCGTNSHAGLGTEGVLMRFDINLNILNTVTYNETMTNADDGWNDMEVTTSDIYLAGSGTLPSASNTKAVWSRFNSSCGLVQHVVYDAMGSLKSTGKKILVFNSVFLGLDKKTPEDATDAHEVRYNAGSIAWDLLLPSAPSNPGIYCGVAYFNINDASINSTGQYIYVTGSASDCILSGTYNTDAYLIKINATTGSMVWDEFISTGSITSAGINEMGLKVFALDANDCIVAGLRYFPSDAGKIFEKRYTTSYSRLGNTDGQSYLNALSIYPNPAGNYISVTGFEKDMQVVLTDIAGHIIKQQKITPGIRMDVADVSRGNYIMVCKDASGYTSYHKIILQ